MFPFKPFISVYITKVTCLYLTASASMRKTVRERERSKSYLFLCRYYNICPICAFLACFANESHILDLSSLHVVRVDYECVLLAEIYSVRRNQFNRLALVQYWSSHFDSRYTERISIAHHSCSNSFSIVQPAELAGNTKSYPPIKIRSRNKTIE